MVVDEMALADRINEAAEQLNRYGGEPHYEEFGDLLEAVAELNDDIKHMRALPVVELQANNVRVALEIIMARYMRDQ